MKEMTLMSYLLAINYCYAIGEFIPAKFTGYLKLATWLLDAHMKLGKC